MVGFLCGAAVAGTVLLWPEARAERRPRLARLYEAVDTVLDRYVEPVDVDQAVSRGIKHIVGGLDPHSHYLTRQERQRLRDGLERGGTTGLQVRLKVAPLSAERSLEIVAVSTGSSAWRAGLRPGDRIVRIGKHPAETFLNQAEVELALLGEPGSRLDLEVQRPAEVDPVALDLLFAPSRRLDPVAARSIRRGDHTYLHLAISSFRVGTGQRVHELLVDHRLYEADRMIDGIILDLRGNPGGAVDEALIVADLFVAEGVLTRTRGRGGRILREERAHAAGTDRVSPLVVLQDRHTGSAAELLAAALQDHGRAVVLGERSYGKGTVQDVIGMNDGSVLTLTIARYFSPRDRIIEGNGVAPDIYINTATYRGQVKLFETAQFELGR